MIGVIISLMTASFGLMVANANPPTEAVSAGSVINVIPRGNGPTAGSASPEVTNLKPKEGDNCFKCHSGLNRDNLKNPATSASSDLHFKNKITCSQCHGGDPAAHMGNQAHVGNFIAKPDAEKIVALCGGCHQKPAENYKQGPHALNKDAPRRPNCVTCHSAHQVVSASIKIISEPLCSSCHNIAQARRISKALEDAEDSIAGAASTLHRNGDNPELKGKLAEARAELRGLSHSLDLFAITRNAAKAITVADEITAKVKPHIMGTRFGRNLRRVGVAVVMVFGLTALIFGIRFARNLKLPTNLRMPAWRRFRTVTVVFVLALLGIFIISGYNVQHYIQHNPRFCLSCHTMDSAFKLWSESGHNKIECHACHEPDLASNLHQLWFYAVRRPEEVVKHASVKHEVCETCHSTDRTESKWNKILETPGHRVHVGDKKIECVQCHAISIHRFKPQEDLCQGCHKSISLKAAGTMSEMHCMECHPFLAKDSKRSLRPDRAACLECHQDTRVKSEDFPENAPMHWDCRECHKPHTQLKMPAAGCLECHDDAHKHDAKHAQCIECHKPHSWVAR